MEPMVAFPKQFVPKVKRLAAPKKQQPVLGDFRKALRVLPNLSKVLRRSYKGHNEQLEPSRADEPLSTGSGTFDEPAGAQASG